MSSSDRLSFEQAAKDLAISENELEQLVASGEITAIKQGDGLYFKRTVIDSYRHQRKSKGSGDDILLSDEELNLLDDVDEIDFGIETDAAAESTTPVVAAGGPASAQRSGPAKGAAKGAKGGSAAREDVPLDEDFELSEISLEAEKEDSGAAVLSGDETVLNLDGILEDEAESATPIPASRKAGSGAAKSGAAKSGTPKSKDGGKGKPGARSGGPQQTTELGEDTLLDTDILDLGDDADTFDLDTTEDTLLDATEEGTLLRGGGARVMQMKRKESHPAWTYGLLTMMIVSLAPLAVLLSTVFLERVGSREVPGEYAKNTYQWIRDSGGFFRDNLFGPVADLFR